MFTFDASQAHTKTNAREIFNKKVMMYMSIFAQLRYTYKDKYGYGIKSHKDKMSHVLYFCKSHLNLVTLLALVALVTRWSWWLYTIVNICQLLSLLSPLLLGSWDEGSLVLGMTCHGVLGLVFAGTESYHM